MVEKPIPSYRDIRTRAGPEILCRDCGLCCDLADGALTASREDVIRWLREGRRDILQFVHHEIAPDGSLTSFDPEIWLEPGMLSPCPVVRCPFLKCSWEQGFHCTIYPTRPRICADFDQGGDRCLNLRRHRLHR